MFGPVCTADSREAEFASVLFCAAPPGVCSQNNEQSLLQDLICEPFAGAGGVKGEGLTHMQLDGEPWPQAIPDASSAPVQATLPFSLSIQESI